MPLHKITENQPKVSDGSDGIVLRREQFWYFDSPADTALSVRAHGSFAAYKSDHPSNSTLYRDDVEIEPLDVIREIGGFKFRVTTTYRSKPPDFYVDPLDKKEVVWGGAERTEEVFVDVDGNTMVNSAGEVFDPLPTRSASAGSLTIINRQANNPGPTIASFEHSVNAGLWFAAAAGTAKIGQPTARQGQEAGVGFWEVTWPISLNPDGHNPLVPDSGYNELVNGELTRILLPDGSEPPQPSLLNGAGTFLGSGTPVTARPKLYRERNFGLLNFPNPWA